MQHSTLISNLFFKENGDKYGSVAVGLNDREGLFQPDQFYGSMILLLIKKYYHWL